MVPLCECMCDCMCLCACVHVGKCFCPLCVCVCVCVWFFLCVSGQHVYVRTYVFALVYVVSAGGSVCVCARMSGNPSLHSLCVFACVSEWVLSWLLKGCVTRCDCVCVCVNGLLLFPFRSARARRRETPAPNPRRPGVAIPTQDAPRDAPENQKVAWLALRPRSFPRVPSHLAPEPLESESGPGP